MKEKHQFVCFQMSNKQFQKPKEHFAFITMTNL